jgi:hyperosmotically inducible protein
MTDLEIRQHILDELAFDPRVDAAHIGVGFERGVATLTGHVASYHERLAALNAVRRIKDVHAIADEMDVRYPSDKKVADDEIAKRAIDILDWDATLPKDSIRVLVKNGCVTLTGTVDWHYQRLNAADDIRKLSGVHSIVNEIALKPHAKLEDVQRKIEDALIRHGQIEARGIRVTVGANDRVILEGKVANWDERFAVENAVWSAGGVRSVEDRLTIG